MLKEKINREVVAVENFQLVTKNDYAYHRLKELIVTCELAPGETIQQSALAAKIGVSTTPLREAIRRLGGEGLIDLAAHKNTKVSGVSADEARHLLEVRRALEPLASQLAAERRTEEDIVQIKKCLSRLEPVYRDIDALQAHREFHQAIYTASKNPILIEELGRLWAKSDRYRVIALDKKDISPERESQIKAEHQQIVDAIVDGDGDSAHAVTLLHVSRSLGSQAVNLLD